MNVHEKILEVMKRVQYLAKDDQVEFKSTRYKAISEEKVTTAMRKALIEVGLVVYPVEQHRERIGTITSVDVRYRIVNTDDPADYIEVVSSGDGADTQDKGAGKAMTYAYKYMWLRTFAVPTGEDPDKISSDELDAKQAEAMQKAVNTLKKRVFQWKQKDAEASAAYINSIGAELTDPERIQYYIHYVEGQIAAAAHD